MIVNQNDDRIDELNQRLIPFQMSSHCILEPVYNMRSVTTRRDIFPCVERRRTSHEPARNDKTPFRITSGFCAGNDHAPRSGFCVDTESALQPRRGIKNDERREYIPDSSSDLYSQGPFLNLGRQEPQPFLLWEKTAKITEIPDFVANRQIGQLFFNNDTRTQRLYL